nr:hypothetical protein [Tanacetum cinerariifolium]
MSLLQEVLDTCATLTKRVEYLEYDKVAQALEIKNLKRKVKKLEKEKKVRVLKLRKLKRVETLQRVDTSEDTLMDDAANQERIIDELDKDDVVALMDDKEEDKKDEEANVVEDDQVQGRQAKIYKIDMDHASKVLSIKEDKPAKVQDVVYIVTTAKLITKALWSLVKEKFSTSKAKNFSDDFFLTTLERRYLLLRFTLDQMLNAVRLQVEDESDMALELLSFGVDAAMDLKEKKTLKVFTAAGEELSAVKQKLMLLDSAAEGRLILLSQVKTANDKCCCCSLRNMVIEIVVLNILSDALPITTNGIQLTHASFAES